MVNSLGGKVCDNSDDEKDGGHNATNEANDGERVKLRRCWVNILHNSKKKIVTTARL